MPHLDVDPQLGAAIFASPPAGPVVMLNLLRFAETADYAAFPKLAPMSAITGAEAYGIYSRHTLPYLQGAGGEVLFYGDSASFLIGPTDETWDKVMLVRYPDAQAFLGMTSNPGYLTGLGHRTAALADSRLLPISPVHVAS